jgi:hypothetical protein
MNRHLVVLRGSAARDDAGPMGRAWWCWWPLARLTRGEYAYIHLELHWLCFYFVAFLISSKWYQEDET